MHTRTHNMAQNEDKHASHKFECGKTHYRVAKMHRMPQVAGLFSQKSN